MLITKSGIIRLLESSKKATIAFKGLVTKDQVRERRADMIREIILRVEEHNQLHPEHPEHVLIADGAITAGASTVFLPSYPRTGDVVVRSKDYTIDGVHCAFKDIVTESFISDGKEWQFMTTNGSVVSIEIN